MSAPAISRRRRRGGAQAGFTLVELIMGIILASIFALALYSFFFSGLTSSTTHQNQARAQSEARAFTTLFERELRQAVTPDAGLTPPISSLSPTAIVFHVDNNRTPGATAPRPQRVRYRISGTDLVREFANPIGTAPPYTYGAYTGTDVIVRNVANGAVPLFVGRDVDGANLAATIAAPTTANVVGVRVDLLVQYRTGSANTTLEITTDVAPRNPRSS